MMRFRNAAALAAAALLALGPAAAGARGSGEQSRGAKALAPAEVKSYQGANLSSVNDFPDNSIKGPQHVDRDAYRLTVGGLVKTPITLSYDEVLKRQAYSKAVTLHCVEGWDATILWEGVRVKDLLSQAGFDPSAATVLFTAADGYTTSLPLSFILDREIILAAKMNGIPVPEARGFPFVLVAEDKWGYKWIKWVTRIDVSRDADFRGYWEQRGYSNEGNYGGPMFQ